MDCTGLMTETVGVRRSLLLEVGALVVSIPLTAFFVGLFLSYVHDFGPLRLLYPAFVTIFPAVWAIRSLTRPHWFRLDDEGVTISRVLGSRDRLPLSRVQSHLGRVVDVRRNHRFPVGEAKFPGAEKLHRAIRVRQAVAGVRTGAV